MTDTVAFTHPASWTDSPEGYLLMFIAMFIGGPAVTSASAFGAAFGVFNIWVVFFISIASNILPDGVWYAVGYWGREQLIEKLVNKYGKYFKITKEKVLQIEKLYEDHVGKTLIFVKLVPLLATPGLIAAGVMRVPMRKFAFWSIIVTFPTSILFLIIGYYFGAAYEQIIKYTEYGGLSIFLILVLFIIISHLYRKFEKKLANKIEHVDGI